MTKAYFQTTNDCNLSCAHCFQNSGPGKKHTTLSESDFKKVIRHLPWDRNYLALTGGEIFKDISRLWNYLEIVKNENELRKNPISVNLQTNGFWGNKSDSEIHKIFNKLEKYEVEKLDITSRDKYHEQAGFNFEVLDRIEKISKKYLITDVKIRGAGPESKIFPKGRGKNISDKLNFKASFDDCKGNLNSRSFTIDTDGTVYMCCFNIYALPGNIIEEPLEEIIERAKKDEIIQALNKKGIKGIARLEGMEKRDIRSEIEKSGECGLCAKINNLF